MVTRTSDTAGDRGPSGERWRMGVASRRKPLRERMLAPAGGSIRDRGGYATPRCSGWGRRRAAETAATVSIGSFYGICFGAGLQHSFRRCTP